MTDWFQLLSNAGLPVKSAGEDSEGVVGASFTRPLSDSEQLTCDTILDPDKAKKVQALIDAAGLGNWWTWTQVQFETWCNNNLMTDAAIDGLTLNATLKTNLKANNLFTRNAGKLLVAMRDVIKWIVKHL